jgi:hypothetical protein
VKFIKAILSVTLTVFAFLTLIAGINVDRPTANPKWRPFTPNGLTFPLLRSESTIVYDPTSNRIILFAGKSPDQPTGNPRLNDVWILTNANGLGGTGEWSNLVPSGTLPPVRSNHSAVYDVANNRMIIYGGCGAPFPQTGCLPIANSVWVLDHANGLGGTPTWIHLFPTGTPPGPRQGHQAVYDPNTNSMIVWAGQNGGGAPCAPDAYSDVWVLSNANGIGGTPQWTRLLPTGGPPAGRYFSTAVYDSPNNILIVFGGVGVVGTECQRTNAVWALSHANGTGGNPVWTNLIPQDADGSPPNRQSHAAVYAPSNNTMTIFGGLDNDQAFLGDTWVLSNANGIGSGDTVWNHLIYPTGPVPSTRWNGGVIDTARNRMILFGGAGDPDGGTNGVPLWSTWMLGTHIGPPPTTRSNVRAVSSPAR